MQQEHKRAIQVNFSSLVDRTDLKMMVSALYEKGVFSEAMLEHYANENISQLDRKRHLFNAITRRGPEAFAKLTEALMEMGHWDLVRDLDPNSPLHVRPSRPELRLNMPRPREETDENNFVSLKNKKQEAKNMRQPGDSPSLPSPHSWPAAVETVVSVAPPLASNDATDLSLDIPDFHIKKSTSFFQEDESKGIRLYRTRGKYRGKLLLLSYVDFAYGTDEFRHGVEVDTKNLKYLFDEMGFQVLTYTNLTLDETKHMLQSLESVLVGAEMVFTVVSSHGYAQRHKADTSIRCSDGRLTTDGEIIEFFNHRNMPKLLGVPKVFIFQVCRGDVDDFVNMNANANPNLNVRALSAPRPQRVAVDAGAAPPSPAPPSPSTPPADLRPLYSDTLVVHSTVPGFVSHRDKFDGSWYIQVLCEVFAESAHDCHVEKLFKLVDERMQQKYGIQTSSVDSRGFNKKLYLHPGLYE